VTIAMMESTPHEDLKTGDKDNNNKTFKCIFLVLDGIVHAFGSSAAFEARGNKEQNFREARRAADHLAMTRARFRVCSALGRRS
jgi:hypothetical protein